MIDLSRPPDFRFLSYRHGGGVARITLDDPGRGNPLHPGSVAELLGAVRCAHADGARVVVLAARGPFFCVGGDLKAFAAAEDMSSFVDDLAEALHRVVSELIRSHAVVVAVVQGPAAGAGCALAAAADLVLAAESSSFTLAYTSVGLSHDGGSSLLVHSLGLHRMLRLALLNDRLSAREAYDAGLVARVVPDDELAAAAEGVVQTLGAGPSFAYAEAKRLLRDAAEPAAEAVMRRETLSVRATAGVDGREGVAAFLQKRPPSFARPGRATDESEE